MDNASLRKLRRADLLEILVALSEENDRLRERVAELEAALESREIRAQKAGSLAEVAAEVSGILLAAQQTAEVYLQNLGQVADVEVSVQSEDKSSESESGEIEAAENGSPRNVAPDEAIEASDTCEMAPEECS